MKVFSFLKVNNRNMKRERFNRVTLFKKLAAVLFWLAVWFLASVIVNSKLVLVSPFEVLNTLSGLILIPVFWNALFYSFFRIIEGFFLALLVGIILAVSAARFKWAQYLFSPVSSVIKATPVASFIILALFWIGSQKLSTFTSFLMVMPIIYTNILQGILQTDKNLLEMSKVFRMKMQRKFLYIYLPEIKPFFISACSLSLGMCWKAGIAAEVIGQPKGSVGEQLYYSKLYFNTSELLAWTAVIIIISFAFEKLFVVFIKKIFRMIGSV